MKKMQNSKCKMQNAKLKGEEKTVLVAENLSKNYIIGGYILPALKGVSLQLFHNEILAIVGPSGAGKTTLLHLLGLLDKPTDGEIYVGDRRASLLNDEERAKLRNKKIGFVFQCHYLLPEFNTWENVSLPALIAGEEKNKSVEKAKNLLNELGLGNRLDHRPPELSLGEAQRVALARALINDPEIILADEPTGNLDWETGEEVKYILWEEVKKRNCSMLFVTHDELLAKDADRILILIDGRFNGHGLRVK